MSRYLLNILVSQLLTDGLGRYLLTPAAMSFSHLLNYLFHIKNEPDITNHYFVSIR